MKRIVMCLLVVLLMAGCSKTAEEKKVDEVKKAIAEEFVQKMDNAEMLKVYSEALKGMFNVFGGIESYRFDTDEPLKQLEDLVPVHLKDQKELIDPWGNPYLLLVQKNEDGKDEILLASGGSDGQFSGWEQQGGYDTCEGEDIIVKEMTCVYGPTAAISPE